MRTIDCFPYNGEAIALFRLEYLWDVVDEFVIVEALETHTGGKKEFLYLDRNAAMLRKFESKITRLVIDRFPVPTPAQLAKLEKRSFVKDPTAWFRESYQRDFACGYLRDLARRTPYIVLGCDSDEIPRREMVRGMRGNYEALAEPHKLEMALFYYSSDWIKGSKWYQAFALNDRGLDAHRLNDIRLDFDIKNYISNAGWHLSYFLTEEEIQRKIRSTVHIEINTEKNRALEWIRECQRTGRDLYKRGGAEDCTRYTGKDLPENLREFETEHGLRARSA